MRERQFHESGERDLAAFGRDHLRDRSGFVHLSFAAMPDNTRRKWSRGWAPTIRTPSAKM